MDTGWTSTYVDSGAQGASTLATATKGRALFEEAVGNVAEFAEEFTARQFKARVDHYATAPTTPPPG